MTIHYIRLIFPFTPCELLTSGNQTPHLSKKPEVLLPPSADKIAIRALASLPHSYCQAIRVIDAMLHKLLCATAIAASAKAVMKKR